MKLPRRMGRKQEEIRIGPPRRKRPGRAVALGALLLLAAGAVLPHAMATRLKTPAGDVADAILVLTGGENRIAEGYLAWKAGKGRDLYILGAGRDTKLEYVLPVGTEVAPSDLARIHIEGWSSNTMENAFSANDAVQSRSYRNVILVTSRYHVPRAHLALRTILPPGVAISVISVPADWGRKGSWHRVPRLYLVEGWKYWGYRVLLRWE